jgi:hypothetical protein
MRNVGWLCAAAIVWTVAGGSLGCSGDSEGDGGAEDTLPLCSDGADNDGDGFVDCNDQDCSIFAACVDGADAGGDDVSGPEDDAEPGTDTAPDEDVDPGDDVAPGEDTSPETDADAGVDPVDAVEDTESTPDAVDDHPCPAFEWCIVASMTVTSNTEDVDGQPTTNTLLPLIGETVEFVVAFNIVNVSDAFADADQPKRRTLLTSPVEVGTLNVGPNVWGEQIQPAIQSGTTQIDLESQPPGVNGRIRVLFSGLPLPGESFTIEASAGGIPFSYDDNGYPIMMPIAGLEDRVYVRRFTDLLTPMQNLTDQAEGTMQWTLHRGLVP